MDDEDCWAQMLRAGHDGARVAARSNQRTVRGDAGGYGGGVSMVTTAGTPDHNLKLTDVALAVVRRDLAPAIV